MNYFIEETKWNYGKLFGTLSLIFFSELFDEKPWQEKDTKSKLKILGALLLGAILTFIFYIL
ncbi:hypothetical protein [Neisseria polysaccharea]|uniref:hypothetical protein n=1 Tax=Neisseria polysaccharea TaxID=489 RepID=UPI00272CF3BE|nr:hypothetical protein [Neisseria polysaccharea]